MYDSKLPIKSWAEEDRPREKMMVKGRESLTNAELIAILIRSGTRELSAVDIARKVLSGVKNDLNSLAKEDPLDLTRFDGIGTVKAMSIVAALG